MMELKKGKSIEGFELKVLSKNGVTIHFEVNMNPVYKGDKVSGYQGIAREITERKRTEEEIKKRLMKFKLDEGELYLVKERVPTLALEAFKELVNVGYDGLIISRSPHRNFSSFIENNIKYYWLSEKIGENTIPPNLRRLETEVESLSNKKIVLLDRLDYLISKHTFKEVLMCHVTSKITYFCNSKTT